MAQKKYKVDPTTGKHIIARPQNKKGTKKPVNSAKLAAQRERMAQNKATTIYLRMPHNRMGGQYGPGKVVVGAALARELLYEEQKQAEADTAFYGTKGAIIVGPRKVGNQVAHVIRQVPVETFDDSLGNDANIAFSIKG